MSGNSDAVAKLRAGIAEPMSGIAKAAKTLRTAQLLLVDVSISPEDDIDIEDALRLVARLTLACEDLATQSKAAEASMRVTLSEIMSETGCTSFDTDGHTVALRNSPQGVRITDLAALPEKFMVTPPQPPPKPDMKAIGTALQFGPVAGAVLANRPAPVVSFTVRKQS